MNEIMYYGGFTLAIIFLAAAAIFFVVFKIPSVHRYFSKNKKKGLVKAEVIEATKDIKRGPKQVTRSEYENRTEVITISGYSAKNESGQAPEAKTDKLDAAGQSAADSSATEII